MDQFIFLSVLAVSILITILWGFKTLPKEKWQIMAVLPKEKSLHGKWEGLNLTYYGLLCANAYTFAVIIFFILGASAGIPLSELGLLILAMLGLCMPASKIMARLVEKKKGTLTVGGAVFIGILAGPWLVYLTNLTLGRAFGFDVNVTVFLSALCVAYAYGEGLGRLACISFGCCYGKPLHQCSPFVQKLFSGFYLVFSGKTKKIAYASGLEGEKVIPVQIMTASLYSMAALFGTWLFLNGYYGAAFLETLIVTQVWRFVSEFFRADFRGGLKITPYQLMALGGIAYSLIVVLMFPAPENLPGLRPGLHALWNPWMIFLIESIWVAAFVHTGRSVVTGAEISFHVHEGKI
ncbi:MAG: prolipoprotein diacylglyceryl transferase [Desulfobacteraceae bacterium]|nr:prolipoprotein diacylglyceryl transferase [Desulfobacteraceae bacterium]